MLIFKNRQNSPTNKEQAEIKQTPKITKILYIIFRLDDQINLNQRSEEQNRRFLQLRYFVDHCAQSLRRKEFNVFEAVVYQLQRLCF